MAKNKQETQVHEEPGVVTLGSSITVTDVFGSKREVIVVAACEQKHYGHWYCVTHDVGFETQLMKDFHIGSGKHVLAWNCFAHGPEVP